jgi:cardiolipin synthase
MNRIQSPGARNGLWLNTVKIELLVDFKEFWTRLSEDIRSAETSVYVQTFALEGDTTGQQLAAALLSSPAADRRILADSFTRVVLSDRFRYSPSALLDRELRDEARRTNEMQEQLASQGVEIRFTNGYGPTPRRMLSRNHKKLIVVDENTAYLGGINFSDHNGAWHDMMLRLEDASTVQFLREDFLSTWNGTNRVARRPADGIEVLTTDGKSNRAVFQRVLDLVDAARRFIFIESPYVTFPFYERLREATRRGVRVIVVTPEHNNWRFFQNYARLESARSGIDLRLFRGRMSHLKAMLIDDENLIAGSTNFDYLSYRVHQELIAVITLPDVITDFRDRVMIPDLANSRLVECSASAASKQLLGLQTRLVDAAMTILT